MPTNLNLRKGIFYHAIPAFPFFILMLTSSFQLLAQPTVLGTQVINGAYGTYNLSVRGGGVRSVRLQATSSASSGNRNWEFATGTASSTNYSTNWRPYGGGKTLSGYNTFIDPTSAEASARYNTSFGGASGQLPAVTANNYYTFLVGGNGSSSNNMSVLETSYNPTNFSSASQSPTSASVGQNQDVTVTITMASALNTDEYLYLRYTTNGWGSSTVVACSQQSGAVYTGIIPSTVNNAAGVTVEYYLFTSNQSSAPSAAQSDFFSLNLYNASGQNAASGGSNYSYTVTATTNFYSKSSGDLNNTSSWGNNPDGTGTAPSNFSTNAQVFNVRNNTTPTIGSSWTVSGTGSKIVIGDGTNACNLSVSANNTISTPTIEISSNGTLSFAASNSGLDVTSISNNGIIGMSNGGAITIASGGSFTNSGGTFTRGTGSITFTGTGTISGTVELNNLNVAGGVDVGTNCTIHGTLSINTGGSLSTNSPTYANTSTLRYNTGGTYGRSIEWNATSSAGYPHHIQISNNTTLNVVNGANSYKKAGGNLTVDNGATFSISGLTAGSGGVGVEFMGNIINDGTISLSSSTNQRLKGVTLTNGSSNNSAVVILSDANGGDLELTGNYTDNATFTSNGRAVFFTGGSNQEIGGTASDPFNIDYVVITKSGGVVQMNKTLLIGAPNDGTGLTLTSANDILVLNGNSLTLGTSGKACAISGLGSIRGSSTSSMTINGTGALGTLRFDAGTAGGANLNSLTINRSTSGAVTLGSALNIFDQLTVTNGTLTTGGNLTLKSTSTNTARVNAIGAGGSISGDVTVERFFTTNRRAWRMVTAPVVGSSNNSIYYNWQNNGSVVSNTGVEIWGPTGIGSAGNGTSTNGLINGPYASMRGWNNSTGQFANVTDTKTTQLFNTTASNSDPMTSYFLFVSGAYGSGNVASGTPGSSGITIKATGGLRQGNQSFSITGATANRFYMIGNPYACPVDLGSGGVSMTNVDDAVWFWDPYLNTSGTSGTGTTGGYVSFTRSSNTYNNVSGAYSNGSDYTRLQSGQAFFVRATAAANLSVDFTESNKGGLTVSQVFRNTSAMVTEKMRITLQRNSGNDYNTTDGAVAFFYPDGEKEVNRMDGQKLMNNANNVMFRRDGANLTFEYRPTIQESDTLFLRLQSTSAGNYRLITEASDFTSSRNLEAILEDSYLVKEQPLSLETAVPYDFTVDGNPASSGDRFRIVFRAKGIVPPSDIDPKHTITLYPNPIKAGESLNIQMHKQEAGKYTVVIYNLMGVQVQQQVILHAGVNAVQNIKLNSNLPAGTYLVNVLDASSRKVEAVKVNIQ